MYGIETCWHKRIVRAGKNTLLPYAENPPDLTIGSDEVLFLDLGPEENSSDPLRRCNFRVLYSLPACVVSTIDRDPKIN